MNRKTLVALIIAAFGVLYSFVLFLPHFFGEVCLFGSTCPTLFGFPVCLYGCIGFLSVFILLLGSVMTSDVQKARMFGHWLFWGTLGGMLFSLYFLIQELFIESCPGGDCSFSLGYPSCLYGLILFFILFLLCRNIHQSTT